MYRTKRLRLTFIDIKSFFIDVIGEDGRPYILYTPDSDVNYVLDELRYTITDTYGETSEATVSLDVQCVSSQTSDNGKTFDIMGMMLMTLMIGLYFVRQEEKRGKRL